MKINKLHKPIFRFFLILLPLFFSLISCEEDTEEFKPDLAYFVSSKKFEVYYSGSTTNLHKIYMGVKLPNKKEIFFYDLYYEQDFMDSWKSRIIVKSKESHFDLDDDVEATLYFEQIRYSTKLIRVMR